MVNTFFWGGGGGFGGAKNVAAYEIMWGQYC